MNDFDFTELRPTPSMLPADTADTRVSTPVAAEKTRGLILGAAQPMLAAALLAFVSGGAATAAAINTPGAYQAQYPDRDPLNDGVQTPAGKMGLVRPGGAAPVFTQTNYDALAGMQGTSLSAKKRSSKQKKR